MKKIDSTRSQKRFKMNRNILMVSLSLLLGAGGVYLARNFIENKINYYKTQLEKTEEMVEVVVPARNMARGEIINKQNLVLREIPLKYAHANAVMGETYANAVGQKLSFDIMEGKPLLWAHLEGGKSSTFSGKLENGLRALTVPVDEINSISGFLQPTDNIDLLLTYKDEIFPVMQNLLVLATGVKTVVDKTGRSMGKTYNTITVQVTSEEAKKVVLAQKVGKLTATLRNPDDKAPITNSALTVSQLLGKKKITPRKKRKVVKKKGIEFIIGGI